MRILRPSFTLASALVAILVLAPAAPAQETGTIQGIVVDQASQRPLPEAQVSIPGTGIGMLTNNAGRFLLLRVPPGQHTVEVELIGYETASRTVDVTAGQTASLEFALAQTAISMDEIVVTGQGQETARRQLATSVDVISSQEIAQAPVTTVDELLRGRVAGATVNATSSQPGTGSLINFRGISSVSSPQTPVIYIDGVRVDNDISTADGTGGEQSSALADLLTSDIERIEVTKGGAASTLYGADAATGVIQIFTKKGSPGAPRVTARIEQGVDEPELKYIFDTGVIFPELVEAGDVPADFLEQNYFDTGHAQSYYLSVSGGTAEVTYAASGQVQQADGTQPKNGNVSFNLRGGLQASVTDRLRLDFSANYRRADFERLYNGTAIADPLTSFEVGDALFFSGEDNLPDALNTFLLADITEEINRFTFSSGARMVWREGLESRLNVGIDYRGNQQRQFQPIGFFPGTVDGELNRFQRELTLVTLDFGTSFSYPREGPITSAFTFGAQGFREDESIIQANGESYALPGAPDFDEAAVVTASEVNTELFTGGLYFQERVGFGDRLFVTGGLRMDVGTAFGEEVDLQAFPKAEVAYNISDEPAFADALGGVFNELKLRAAYGETGLPPDPFLRDRTFNSISFRGESAPRFDNPGNVDLRPEVTSTIEAGFDAALWNNRIGLGFTYFDATTEDALFFVPEQPVTGQGTQQRNVGTISNTGIEVDLSVQLVNTRNVAWSLNGTYNTVDNKVTDMGGAADFSVDGSQKRVSLDRPVGSWYVTTPVDTNGDGLADGSELQFTGGAATPTKSGSMGTTLSLFNRVSVSALGDWAAGHQVFDWGSVWATFNGIYRRELIEGVEFPERFAEDGENLGEYDQNAARSAFIYDGDWWKLREISLRYNVPEELAARMGFSRSTLYGSVRNVYIWSRNDLIDPELNGISGDGLVLGSESSVTASPPRQFRVGVEVVF